MSAKEDRLLLLIVLLGHALLVSLLALQRLNQEPKPLSIELRLSAQEPETSSAAPAHKPVPAPLPKLALKSMPNPPTPAVASAPSPVPAPAPVSTPAPSPASAQTSSQPSEASSVASQSPAKSAPAQTAATVLPNADAAYLTNPKPGYPPLSRRLGEQGVVTLNVLVGEGGDVQKAEIAKSSGYSRLDEAAVKAIQSWRFTPGKRAGTAQSMWVKVPISFILEK